MIDISKRFAGALLCPFPDYSSGKKQPSRLLFCCIKEFGSDTFPVQFCYIGKTASLLTDIHAIPDQPGIGYFIS